MMNFQECWVWRWFECSPLLLSSSVPTQINRRSYCEREKRNVKSPQAIESHTQKSNIIFFGKNLSRSRSDKINDSLKNSFSPGSVHTEREWRGRRIPSGEADSHCANHCNRHTARPYGWRKRVRRNDKTSEHKFHCLINNTSRDDAPRIPTFFSSFMKKMNQKVSESRFSEWINERRVDVRVGKWKIGKARCCSEERNVHTLIMSQRREPSFLNSSSDNK